MIDLYFATSPNVYKVSIALEEMALEHRLIAVDLSKGEHHDPANLAGANTHKVPVIVDHDPADGGEPLTVFESGAILQYLGEKTGGFLPADSRGRIAWGRCQRSQDCSFCARQCSPSSRRDEKHSSGVRRNSSKCARVRLLMAPPIVGKKGFEKPKKSLIAPPASREQKRPRPEASTPERRVEFDYPDLIVKRAVSRHFALPKRSETGLCNLPLACCISA